MARHFEIRAVQMDLARQMETVDFICNFIDFIAENNYNTLFLYLEWRVRTKTFDIGAKDGYTPAEIRKIVKYAETRGLDVIPGLASIGHAELLLSNEKFKHLCELDGDIIGRHGGSPKMEFCLTNPAVKTFLEAYFSEIAELFPSPYMHIGGDESFNIGYCKECAEKAKTYAGEQKLYGDMVHFFHSVVTGKLKKRIMMWDDMYELYPDAFDTFPKDIIMVNWLYGRNVTGWRGHFSNLEFKDQLAYYEKQGFDYLIAPADYYWSNTETFTALVENRNCMGGLLTIWEKKNTLLYKYFPTVAAVGNLWDNENGQDSDRILHATMAKLFNTDDEAFLHAIEQYLEIRDKGAFPGNGTVTTHSFSGPDWYIMRSLRTIADVLMKKQDQFNSSLANAILDDIIADLIMLEAKARLHLASYKLLNGQNAESFDEIAADIAAVWEHNINVCKQVRTKTNADHFRTLQEGCMKLIADFQEQMENCGKLKVLFALPDLYEAQFVKFRVKAGGKWKDVAQGVFKYMADSLYTKVFFMPDNLSIQEIEISSWGFGGQGICYVSVENSKGKFVPEAVSYTNGDVWHPDYIIAPDATFAYLGYQKTMEGFYDRTKAKTVHTVRLIMKNQK